MVWTPVGDVDRSKDGMCRSRAVGLLEASGREAATNRQPRMAIEPRIGLSFHDAHRHHARSARSSSRCSDSPGSRAAQPSENGTGALERLGAKAVGDELGLVGIGVVEDDHELVAADANHGFLGRGRSA